MHEVDEIINHKLIILHPTFVIVNIANKQQIELHNNDFIIYNTEDGQVINVLKETELVEKLSR